MDTLRIIKKYPNRRLYDTKLSRYITLVNVRTLVMDSVGFRVIDTANGSDITRAILLQIMLEEETGGKPLFNAEMLAQIIRSYGGSQQNLFARYLEASLDLFVQQQHEIAQTWGANPFDMAAKMARRNVQIWAEMQEQYLRAAGLHRDAEEDAD